MESRSVIVYGTKSSIEVHGTANSNNINIPIMVKEAVKKPEAGKKQEAKKHFDAKGVPQIIKFRLTPKRVQKLRKFNARRTAARPEESPVNYRSDALPNTRRKSTPKTPKLRKSLTPGTVVILLKGDNLGKKAIFLKQLKSGLLLISGPRSINHVQLSRVKQQYVIATSTKVDVSAVSVDNIDEDALWPKKKETGKRTAPKTEAEYFAPEKGKKEEKKEKNPKRVEAAKAIDKSLKAAVSKVPLLDKYLRNRFTLVRGLYPHNIKF